MNSAAFGGVMRELLYYCRPAEWYKLRLGGLPYESVR